MTPTSADSSSPQATAGHIVSAMLTCISCLLPLLCGCSMFATDALPLVNREPEYEPPRQIVPVWTDTVLHQSDQPATRGFGGRLMFYGADRSKPVQIRGTLIVYAWDDSQRSLERTPDRKYVFESETMDSHYSQSSIGHSYSFWVPWDPAGGSQQQVTLISRFVSDDGVEVTSTPARLVLPGPVAEFNSSHDDYLGKSAAPEQKPNTELANRDARIRLAGHEESSPMSPAASVARRGRRPPFQSAEIGVTEGFLLRNMQSTNSEPESTEPVVSGHSQQLIPPDVSGAVPASEGKDLPQGHLPHFESRVRTSRTLRSAGGHVRREPVPAEWQHGLPKTPRSSANVVE